MVAVAGPRLRAPVCSALWAWTPSAFQVRSTPGSRWEHFQRLGGTPRRWGLKPTRPSPASAQVPAKRSRFAGTPQSAGNCGPYFKQLDTL